MHVRRIAVLAAATVIGLASCGGGDRNESASVDRTGPTSSAPTGEVDGSPGPTSASSTPVASASPTTASSGPQMIVKGLVEAGSETGCLLLGGYSLVVDSALWHSVLVAGEPVEVTGYVDSNRPSSCQTGQPLVVTDVRPQ